MISSVERKLRDRIEELEETIRQMKEAAQVVEATEHLPLEWNLRPSAERILLALYRSVDGQLSVKRLIQVAGIGPQSHDPRSILRDNIGHLRKRVKPRGIEIMTRYAVGYELPPGSKTVIRTTLEQRVIQ